MNTENMQSDFADNANACIQTSPMSENVRRCPLWADCLN